MADQASEQVERQDKYKTSREVFGIEELLEAILLQFETLDLVHAGRVCRQWHECIKASQSLRQALFLEPIDEKHKEYINWDDDLELPDDDFAYRGYPRLSKTPDTTTLPEELRPGLIVSLHPFLEHSNEESDLDSTNLSTHQWAPTICWSRGHEHFKDGEREIKLLTLSRNGEWRKQFISQPPVTEAGFTVQYDENLGIGDDRCSYQDYHILKRPDGIRLGDLQDHIWELVISQRRLEIERQRRVLSGIIERDDWQEWRNEVVVDAEGTDTKEAILANPPDIRLWSEPIEGCVWKGSPWVEIARKDAEHNEIRDSMEIRRDAKEIQAKASLQARDTEDEVSV